MVKPCNHSQEGGFSAPAWSDYAEKLAFVHLKRDVFESSNCLNRVGIDLGYIREFYVQPSIAIS